MIMEDSKVANETKSTGILWKPAEAGIGGEVYRSVERVPEAITVTEIPPRPCVEEVELIPFAIAKQQVQTVADLFRVIGQ
jgi:hypothetical protein